MELIELTPWQAEVGGFILKIAPFQKEGKRHNACSAAAKHPAAEPAQMIPHPVTVHLFAAKPPAQQPVVQQKERRAEHGGAGANKNLRTE